MDSGNPPAKTIAFQYNPETLKRSLKPQVLGGQDDRAQAVRFTGAPVETLSVEVELDATDALEKGDPTAVSLGIYPLLSALELLVYPRSSQVVSSTSLLNSGVLEIGPYVAPLTLFVWGQKRVIPVSVTGVSVTEQAFNQSLSPIQATVSLEMRVLSYSDLAAGAPGYSQFLVYQQAKEAMSRGGFSANASQTIGVDTTQF
ncbi:MAG TPA: hypothetical protein VHG28_25250 [Longimicrobiaceae bacterium]|nr:hypothetical protein [Longimicrobiaceae bacterium]